ncbi:MAG TPA: protein kinase, partial [Longimicrobiales bacterium]
MNRPTEPNDLPRFAELSAEYEILRELGRGGTAVVYLARDRELEREVAIKVIRTTYVEDEEAAARLVREARTLGRLQHPNIVALFGTRRLRDHSLALIMEYVPGHTLKSEVVQRGPLPHAQVTRVLADIARGLVFAHRQHIVHRDIKPENIYIDRDTGIARLSDFGIARIWDTDSSLTLPGTAIGTPTYMSPEQIEGGELDGRSDLFSLSLVGYEMLTGHRPWAGESLYSIVYKQKHEHLPSLALLRPDVPQALLVAIERALRKEPKDRWPDAEAFLRALGQPVPHHPPHPAPRVTVQPLTAEEDPDGATISYPRPAAAKVTEVTPDPLPMVPVPAATHPEAVREDDDAPVVHTTPRRLVLKRPSPLVAAAVALLLLGAIAAIAIRPWGEPARAEPFVPVPKESPVVAAATPPASKPEPAVLAPVVASGAEQKGVAGDTLPEPLVLRVTDAAGQPARNAAVRFVVLSGSSTVVPVEGRTDTAGVIRARWLPRAPGTHEVEARLEQGGAAATFRARVAPKPAARLLATSAAQQRGKAGSALPPLVVRAEDDAGAPAPGVAVRFEVRSGGGRVTPKEVVTGSDGTARAQWVLGEGEEQEVVALRPGADAPSISFL